MKRIAKHTKDPSASEIKMELDMSLLVQSVQDIDLLRNDQFKDYWASFIKSCLKYGLKPDHPSYSLRALNKLLENVVKDANAGDTYSLICGHSQFVPILFSKTSKEKKEELLKLIVSLVKANPSICSTVQVPVFLGAYNATLSKTDQLLFEILYIHETEGAVNLHTFKPLVWGQAAISKFSVLKKNPFFSILFFAS